MGQIEIRVDGQVVRPRTRDAAYLLAILAANHERELTREWIAERLWPMVDARAGSHNLRRSLWDLRRTLGCAGDRVVVVLPTRNLRLDTRDAEIDVVRFDRAIGEGEIETLQEVVSTYASPFVDSCTDPWAVEEREKRRQAVVAALGALATNAGDSGRLDTAMDYRRQAARIAPLDRPPVRGGTALPGAADVEAYQSFQRSLRADEPIPEAPPDSGATLRAAPLRKDPADVLATAPPLPQRRPLPRRSSAPVGREESVARCLKLLVKHRLVTLTGPGGVGKTRVAIAVAEAAQGRFDDGAVFVELGALTRPSLIASTIAYRLGIPVDAGRSAAETLVRTLATARMVVVLDNCDAVREETARLAAELIRDCPGLRVVATCRKLLRVEGETIQAVAPLGVPRGGAEGDAERVTPPALQLFDACLAEAIERDVTIRITPAHTDAAAAICRRLDGIPLAVELAAGLVPTMPILDLAAALEIEIGRPTFGAVSGMARPRVVRSMLDFSNEHLPEADQRLLRRVAVFAGGWTEDAAQMVCLDGEGESAGPALSRLATRRLLIQDNETGRWDLLDTVRAVMQDRLVQSGDAEAVRARHYRFFHDFALRRDIMPELQADVENLRAALDWCVAAPGRAAGGIAICSVFAVIAFERDVYAEVRERLTELLARPELEKASSERAHGLQMLGYFSLKQGDVAVAVPFVREAVATAERIRDRSEQRASLRLLGEAEDLAGDLTAARLALEKSVTLSRSAHDTLCLSESLRMLGAVWEKIGNLDQAERHLKEALDLMEPIGHGDWPLVLCNLGSVAFRRGDHAEASACARRMLETRRAQDNRAHVEDCLELKARLAVADGHFYRAARLYGAMMRIVEAVGATKYWARRLDFVARIRAVQHILGEDVYAKAYAEGQQMTWVEAVAFALDQRSRS
jgi:non-specific serine/threonine protein kinase